MCFMDLKVKEEIEILVGEVLLTHHSNFLVTSVLREFVALSCSPFILSPLILAVQTLRFPNARKL